MPNNHTIAQRKYDKANCTHVTLKFNNRTDADVIERILAAPSRQDYIRQLIRKDLASSQEHNTTNKKED